MARICAFLVAVPLCAQTVQNINYSSGQNQTVSAPALSTVTAGPNVTVASGATVTFQALNSITLGNGFTAAAGSTFRARIVSDTWSPTAPGNLSATSVTTTSFTFNWTAATDNSAVTAYEVTRNGTVIGTVASLSLAVTGLQPATTYTMGVRALDATGNASAETVGAFTTLSNFSAPQITAQPSNQSVIAGSSVTLVVVASGNPAPTYRWRKAGADIPGATSSSYSIGTVQSGHAGSYDVVVTNSMGSVTSNVAVLTVNPNGGTSGPAVVSNQPINQSPAFVASIAAGFNHSVALRQDGVIWTWGHNGNGQIGDGTTTNRPEPTLPPGVNGVLATSLGAFHTVAVTSSRTVLAWGDNARGQLGDGTTSQCNTAVTVIGLSNVVSVAAGYSHTVALLGDGSLRAWGNNDSGQLGDGTSIDRSTTVAVPGLANVSSITAGHYHTLALKKDGTVWAWGRNTSGQLGVGTSTNLATPTQVGGLTGVLAIAAGGSHSLALKSDGTVWAWGANDAGQLGDGTTTARTTPVQVSGMTGAVFVTAGLAHSAACRNDGLVFAWGRNADGQLGDGTTTNRLVPVQVSGLTGAISVAAGGGHTLALRNDGAIWTWGDGAFGQLGDGSFTDRLVPTQSLGVSDALFAMNASGSPTLSYQWQRKAAGTTTFVDLANNAGFGGVNSATLRVKNPTTTMSGDEFRCVVSNSLGTATSSAAALVIGPPTLAIVGGNNQSAIAGQYNASAFDVALWNSAGTVPLVNAPITFIVQSGGGQLATTNVGSPTLTASLTLATDLDGTAQAFYKHPAVAGVLSQITAGTGAAQVVFSTNTQLVTDRDNDGLSDQQEAEWGTSPDNADHDGDGMPDGWEVAYGLSPLTPSADGDLDNDGMSNLQEYLNGRYPNDKSDAMPMPAGFVAVLKTPGGQYFGIKGGTWEIGTAPSPQP